MTEKTTITGKRNEETGTDTFRLHSRFQGGTAGLRVVEPDNFGNPGKEVRILFILPVNPAGNREHGDGLEAVRKTNLHNELGLILAAPEFYSLPWYCDNPNSGQNDESFFLNDILPFLDRNYPAEKTTRLLLGFSKSGWGALSLLLRNPELFAAAAAWDAPLMEETPKDYGMKETFGSLENFNKYRIPLLLKEKAPLFIKEKRIALSGNSLFGEQMEQAHKLLDGLGIPHDWDNSTKREHKFGSGWEREAILSLDRMSKV